jgi:hypothetical protein
MESYDMDLDSNSPSHFKAKVLASSELRNFRNGLLDDREFLEWVLQEDNIPSASAKEIAKSLTIDDILKISRAARIEDFELLRAYGS